MKIYENYDKKVVLTNFWILSQFFFFISTAPIIWGPVVYLSFISTFFTNAILGTLLGDAFYILSFHSENFKIDLCNGSQSVGKERHY